MYADTTVEISELLYKINFGLVPKQFIDLFTRIEDILIIQDNNQVLHMPFLGLD